MSMCRAIPRDDSSRPQCANSSGSSFKWAYRYPLSSLVLNNAVFLGCILCGSTDYGESLQTRPIRIIELVNMLVFFFLSRLRTLVNQSIDRTKKTKHAYRLMCLSFDAIMVYNFGWISVVYLLLSMLLGLGPHPMAGHFIAGSLLLFLDSCLWFWSMLISPVCLFVCRALCVCKGLWNLLVLWTVELSRILGTFCWMKNLLLLILINSYL